MVKPLHVNSPFTKGSEWRRWDLHVHTPDSVLGSAFKNVQWPLYIDELERSAQEKGIAVIGITDYMSVEGYEKLLAAKKGNPERLKSINLLIPNIEFRLMPSTSDAKALNLHILVDPTEDDHIEKIKRSLSKLQITYKSEKYSCEKEQLIQFGIAQNPQLKNDPIAAYKFGIEQFKPGHEILIEWYQSEAWLRKNSLVGIANGKDGISGLPLNGFAAIRDTLLQFCDFIFSGLPNDKEHYLGRKNGIDASEIKRQYRSLKPCIHGSDAHSLDKLFVPDLDRFCWIKSDPTFEGLRQVIWEPESRIQIGVTMPQISDESQVIDKIEISDGNGWFETSIVELNPGLVAIVGEKGSGKTAFADLIAFAAGEPLNSNSQSSFITKGKLHLNGVKVQLTWKGGVKSSGVLITQPHKVQRPLVRYLSQDFVERLCSSDTKGGELQLAIEEVVFSHLGEILKEESSSFSELRRSRESVSQARKDSFRGELATLHKEIERLIDTVNGKAPKIAQIAEIKKQIEDLNVQLPEVTASANQTILNDLDVLRKEQIGLQSAVSFKSRQKRVIEDFVENYTTIKSKLDHQLNELIQTLDVTTIPETIFPLLKPEWSSEGLQVLLQTKEKTQSEIDELMGNIDCPPSSINIYNLEKRIKILQSSVSADEVNRIRLLELQKQIESKHLHITRFEREITEIDGKHSKILLSKKSQRLDEYLAFFSALKGDEEGLKTLYEPLKTELEALGVSNQFELSVGYSVDVDSWFGKVGRFFDIRRSQAQSKKEQVEKFILEKLVPSWKTGDIETIRPVFVEFIEIIEPEEFMVSYASPSLDLVDLFDWMFSIDHISISYNILYEGIGLEYLSPGTRGIALLVLYLLMDDDDKRPLLIDQPEGNLDNSSVYEQLVPYIRSAKLKRQIILVTHNPNLVVATDAEQVVIATASRPTDQQYPRIGYKSGALENIGSNEYIGIREAVCTLLEGGAKAFQERESRYALQKFL